MVETGGGKDSRNPGKENENYQKILRFFTVIFLERIETLRNCQTTVHSICVVTYASSILTTNWQSVYQGIKMESLKPRISYRISP